MQIIWEEKSKKMLELNNNSKLANARTTLLSDVRAIIEQGRKVAYEAVGQTAIATY